MVSFLPVKFVPPKQRITGHYERKSTPMIDTVRKKISCWCQGGGTKLPAPRFCILLPSPLLLRCRGSLSLALCIITTTINMFQRSTALWTRRALRHRAVVSSIRRSLSTETAAPPVLSKTEQWQQRGILDERGLVNFDTLHNMQVRSCEVFAHKNLFATFSEESQSFEWMTFQECKRNKKSKELMSLLLLVVFFSLT